MQQKKIYVTFKQRYQASAVALVYYTCTLIYLFYILHEYAARSRILCALCFRRRGSTQASGARFNTGDDPAVTRLHRSFHTSSQIARQLFRYSYDTYQLLKRLIIRFNPPTALTFPSRISGAIKGKELTAISKKKKRIKKERFKGYPTTHNQRQLKSNDFVLSRTERSKRNVPEKKKKRKGKKKTLKARNQTQLYSSLVRFLNVLIYYSRRAVRT